MCQEGNNEEIFDNASVKLVKNVGKADFMFVFSERNTKK